jgi:hypothetical protein
MTTELKVGDLAPEFRATAVGGIYGDGQEVKTILRAAPLRRVAYAIPGAKFNRKLSYSG